MITSLIILIFNRNLLDNSSSYRSLSPATRNIPPILWAVILYYECVYMYMCVCVCVCVLSWVNISCTITLIKCHRVLYLQINISTSGLEHLQSVKLFQAGSHSTSCRCCSQMYAILHVISSRVTSRPPLPLWRITFSFLPGAAFIYNSRLFAPSLSCVITSIRRMPSIVVIQTPRQATAKRAASLRHQTLQESGTGRYTTLS